MVATFEVHIVSHFREDRETQLDIVFSAINSWKNCISRIVLTSNNANYQNSQFFARWQEKFGRKGNMLDSNVVSDLANPRMLTWAHKAFLSDWLARASPNEDFFIYIEDDIEILDSNITYVQEHFARLKKEKLIPGFIRYEKKSGEQRLVDVHDYEFWERDRSIRIGSQLYHANRNPYWAGYILDAALAREYVASRSFDPTTSEFVPWNIQERSAMGLTYESASPSLRSRVVVPMVEGYPDPRCLVWHCSNNYTDSDHPIIGALDVKTAYRAESRTGYFVRKAKRALDKAFRR